MLYFYGGNLLYLLLKLLNDFETH